MIYSQSPDCEEPSGLAERYINAELGVQTAGDALCGAMDIIAEKISDEIVRKKAEEK